MDICGEIESIAFGGNGILKHNGRVVFVPFTAPQDQIAITLKQEKKQYAFGSLEKLKSPGPERTRPLCIHFGECGGCQFQHLSYPAQLRIKRSFIVDALERIGKLSVEVPPVLAASHPWNYRCHITLRLNPMGSGFQAGYTHCDNQSFVPISSCPLFNSPQEQILSQIQDIVGHLSNAKVKQASLRVIKLKGNYLLAFTFFPHLPRNISFLDTIPKDYPIFPSLFAKSPQKQLCFGTAECITESLGITSFFSPYGFLQNYPEQRDAIYQTILSDLPQNAKKVLDLYCGIGITSLLLAKQGKTVIGIESNAESIATAKRNAQLNHLPQVLFYHDKVESKAPSLLASFNPDALLCNPPRQGLHPTLLDILIKKPVPYLQYLSCMPPTLARDLKSLKSAGYILEKVQGFDMFPQTTHVETLVLLRHSHAKSQQ